jgi:DNA-binding SARP family transcriptional activator
VTTLQAVELGVLGPLRVRQDGAPVAIPGAKPRAVLTMLGLHHGSVVSADTLVELLWGDDPPRTAVKALQTHISSLRRALGDGFVLTQGTGWAIAESEVDASRYKSAARLGRDAAATGDVSQAVARFEEALALWRGIPELPDGRRGTSEKTRWIEGHAALVEDRADALLATARAAEIIGELEAAVAEAPLRERRWGQLMLALYRAGRQGDALAAYQRARTMLADELGIDPGPELRRLEAAIVAQDASLDVVVAQSLPSVMRAVTFLLTDIEGSTAAWEADAAAMALALARHDELAEQVVTSRGGRLIKTRGEGDATFSVFERPSAAAAAAMELQDAITHEQWGLREPMRIRIALHTGEVELRDGDYFGRAVNRAARLRSLAVGGQILCSGATAELVIDSLPEDVVLADLGLRELRNLARPEHVFELRLETAEEVAQPPTSDAPPMERPGLPSVLIGTGPFVGRGSELEKLLSAWQTSLGGGACAALIAGEPGVGKTRLAGEWSRQAYEQGAVVLYGRCDEDLGAPYQPFAEALRALVPCVGTSRLRGLRGVEALLPLVPGLVDEVPDLAAPTRADPDTERYALFDAVVALLEMASTEAPVVLVLDDLHWAAKPTLLLLRHALRFGDRARLQIVGTYRSTDLDRSHPLAAMLADLHRDGTASRISLSGLDEDDVSTYVAKAGYDDEELGHALASVTGGNPFFLIEALRHVDESGGVWDPSTLPQGVREAVSRRLTRLPIETNKALAAAAVVGSRFALDLVERVVGDDLVDAFDEASKAGIVIEEPGGRYRFNHAIVRQSLLAELPSMRRMRLHQRIATTLEDEPGDDDELLAELAHHYFECAWAGNAAKAVEYCRRAADQAMARLAYEGAADLYGHALHALDEIDDELPDRDDQVADLLVARCEALLAAGDVASAAGAVSQLQQATVDSARLSAWATCFDGQLSVLVHPERLDDVEGALDAAAHKLAEIDDAAGEAKAHTVRATCLARLGRIGDCEIALDDALTAARRAREHRRVNAVLAGAPLAALWGPNPVPRAGGRCLDVVRLLRITTDSPAVEATSTRCQAVLEAFRGRDAAARRMIDSARRTVTELGLRHALLEVEQFAGIVELVLSDPAAAEPHLRQACNGFRRMGLDADTAETAALLGRACLALNRDAEADELCTESERLAGHALKASIAWRTLRAQLLSRRRDHDEARRVAQAAITLAERTDALVDHGDACLSLATVLAAAGDAAAARSAAERAANLYERKGAAALADKARSMLDESVEAIEPTPPEVPVVETRTAAVQAGERLMAAIAREAWDEFEQMFAPAGSVESRRKVLGFNRNEFRADEVIHQTRRDLETGVMRLSHVVIAVRGDRLALARVTLGTVEVTPGAPQDEFLQLYGIDEEGRIALQIWFDLEDMDAAIAELDALHARFEEALPRRVRLKNTASQVDQRFWRCFPAHDWDAMAEILINGFLLDDRRRALNSGIRRSRDAEIENLRAMGDVIGHVEVTSTVIATRGDRLALRRLRFSDADLKPEAFYNEMLGVVEISAGNQLSAHVVFDPGDFDAAIAELDARYLAGEAADYGRTWSVIMQGYASLNRRELPPTAPDWVNIDHRGGTSIAPGRIPELLTAAWNVTSDLNNFVEAVHRLDNLGGVVTHVANETSHEGFHAEWRVVSVFTVEGDTVNRCEVFDEAAIDAAIARFDELSRPAPRLENAASQAFQRVEAYISARDWDGVAEIAAENFSVDDRRRVVNAGIRYGRDAAIRESQSLADVGFTLTTVGVVATRGARLALVRVRASVSDREVILDDAPNLVEIDADGRIVAIIAFDPYNFDTAIAELDARYLAGEAAAYARAWSVIAASYVAINRHEPPATTADWVDVDHRREIAMRPGDLAAYFEAESDPDQEITTYVENVHRINSDGAVITYAAQENSQEGFHAEWRGVALLTVDGDMVNRSETFDEADLDAALARFDELSRPVPRLENAASRVDKRFQACFAAHDWDALAELMSGDFCIEDRRRVVNMGNLHGRDAELGVHAYAVAGSEDVTSTVVATRAQRLALNHYRFSGRDQRPDAFRIEMLAVVEIDADERMAAVVVFDADDIEAAFAELDSRYLAGEAAAHAHTWSVITNCYAAMNRHEIPATTTNPVSIDHRKGTPFARGDVIAYTRAAWSQVPDISYRIETVHQLSDLGAVVTHTVRGTSRDGFEAEWREIALMTFDGDLVSRCELFDEADLDTAIAMFDQLSRPAAPLENAACQIGDRFLAHFAAGDSDAMAEILADNLSNEDRRRVVGTGIFDGRNAQMANTRAIAELWSTNVMRAVVATRGMNLALARMTFSRGDGVEAFVTEFLVVIEIDAEERVSAIVVFDVDDIDAAIAELDARYLAGEAAAHSQTWLAIAEVYAALNRGEMPTSAPDLVDVDHRSLAAIGSGDLMAYLQTASEDTARSGIYIETVHRLTDLGAVTTHVTKATSREGFDAEWRIASFFIVGGDLVNRYEIFDEADLDAALARFDGLQPQARRLENTAAQAYEHIQAHFAARDWDGLAEALADEVSRDDRRRVVGAELRTGHHAVVAEFSALAEIGVTRLTFDTIAIRGGRLLLSRSRASGRDPRADAFRTEVLTIVELDTDERIVAIITFDPDELDAAVAELDARYLTGEAAPHSAVWSTVVQVYAALNRHERPLMTPDVASVDHRRGRAFAPGDLPAFLDATWELMPQASLYIDDVHRLNDIGVVITYVVHGTTAEGFGAEWRQISVLKIAGDCVSRCEMFDEADLDAALARFDELQPQARRLENAASRVDKRFQACFAARNWDAMAKGLSGDFSIEDRRRVVNMGNSQGRDAELTVHAYAAVGTENVKSTVVATREQRLALNHYRFSGRDQRPDAFRVEMLAVVEIDAEERMAAVVVFDADDFDSAIAELDARYLAGEATAHARTWSVITGGHAALNRHELPPTTPDCVSIDHRRGAAFAPGELVAYLRAGWDLDQNIRTYVEVVHRLTDLGAVCTHVAHGFSQEGFDAEWRGVDLLTVDGDMVNRCEAFNEADLDAALAKFEALSRPALRLENPASQVTERFQAHFAARDWAAMGEILADGFSSDDRRRVVGAGVRDGRHAEIADMKATADLGITNLTSTVIATRGTRVALMRGRLTHRDQGPEAYLSEALGIVEVNAYERIVAFVTFDFDDIDAAFAELEARYLAGEAVAHAQTWSLVVAAYAAFDRHELPATDWVTVDHRRATPFASSTMTETLRAIWDLTPDLNIRIEAVHRLNSFGAVITHEGHGSSQEGFDAEWRAIDFLTVEGDRITGCQIFDEADLDTALARFDELHPQALGLENAASQAVERYWKYFAAREWAALAETMAEDICSHDRRRVVNGGELRGRAAHVTNMRAVAEVGFEGLTSTVVASRGQHLTLIRIRSSMHGSEPGEVTAEMLSTIEIDTDNRLTAAVIFGGDELDAAVAELDARYLAGEAAPYAHIWTAMAQVQAAYNRHEVPPATADWVNIDHRRGRAFAPGDTVSYLRATYDVAPNVKGHVEAVHQLNELGVVITAILTGTSQEGFGFEWREVALFAFEGDMVCRFEVFDETDLDAALARFDELQPQAPRLENGASRAAERAQRHFVARDWVAMAEALADDVSTDDRRRVVNTGIRRGRDVELAKWQATSDIWSTDVRSTAVATRGERLVLLRFVFATPEAFSVATLAVIEINDDNRIAASVVLNVDDIDAALEELDARYLAGEAAAHADAWSLIAQAYAAVNRHELPPTTPDWVNIDHRRGRAFEPGDLAAYLHATWDLAPDVNVYVEAVHRLSNRGGLVTHCARGSSQEGFDAEWREIILLTFEAGMVNHFEVFDETDLDAAIARFQELQSPTRRLKNAAARADNRFFAHTRDRNWVAAAEILADNGFVDDRRRVVNIGVWEGRDVVIANLRALAEALADVTSTVIAVRGERLALTRISAPNRDLQQGDFGVEMLCVAELDTDDRLAAHVMFDVDDIDAAFEELDARYLADEAAAHSRTWTALTQVQAAYNRHEVLPTTEDWVNIDHRRGRAFAPGDVIRYLRATYDVAPNVKGHIEAVHRLTNLGAVATEVVTGTSQEGFDAEWREIGLFAFEGDLICRFEMFDEADLDAALARFDELDRSPSP